jgi:hypothetical protein
MRLSPGWPGLCRPAAVGGWLALTGCADAGRDAPDSASETGVGHRVPRGVCPAGQAVVDRRL